MAVYFIRAIGAPGPVKIGYSYRPDMRLHHYNQWAPFPLEVAATLPGDQRLEGRLHRKFHHLHSHHEWFRESPEITAMIDAINDGSFSMDDVPLEGSPIRSQISSATWARRRAAKAEKLAAL